MGPYRSDRGLQGSRAKRRRNLSLTALCLLEDLVCLGLEESVVCVRDQLAM